MVHGYYRGKRGLRQGDSLSPYLFVIALNYLSLLLDKVAKENKFQYHFNCEKTKLTHLCFADDLLIFIDRSLSSVQAILQTLRKFELMSGLAVSLQKSCFSLQGYLQMTICSSVSLLVWQEGHSLWSTWDYHYARKNYLYPIVLLWFNK